MRNRLALSALAAAVFLGTVAVAPKLASLILVMTLLVLLPGLAYWDAASVPLESWTAVGRSRTRWTMSFCIIPFGISMVASIAYLAWLRQRLPGGRLVVGERVEISSGLYQGQSATLAHRHVFGIGGVWAARLSTPDGSTTEIRVSADAVRRSQATQFSRVGDFDASSGEVIYRTPGLVRIAIVALVVTDVVGLEAILQTMRVIPAGLQALILLLVALLISLLAFGLSSFMTVRAGPTWIATHRGRWTRIDAAEVHAVQVLGLSPRACSVSLIATGVGGRRPKSVRFGAIACRDRTLRTHLSGLVKIVMERGDASIPVAACQALNLEPSPRVLAAGPARSYPFKWIAGAVVGAAVGFATHIQSASQDDWAPPVALGLAAAALASTLLAWVTGPGTWARRERS